MHYRLLILCCFVASSLLGTIPNDLAQNIDVLHRLDVLYTSQYGPNHPLRTALNNYRAFIARHTCSFQRSSQTRTSKDITISAELQTVLDTIKDYAQTILAQHQVLQQDGSAQPLTTATLPLPTAQTPIPIVPVTTQPNITPPQQDAALQQYLQIITALQQHHPSEQQTTERKKIMGEQLRLLGIGTAVISFLSLGIWYMISSDRRKLRKYNNQYAALRERSIHDVAEMQQRLTLSRQGRQT